MSDGEKLNKIEELKSKLFSKNYQTKIEHRDTFSHIPSKDVPESWRGEKDGLNFAERLFMKTSVFKKFFVFSVVFFVLALGYASYMFFGKGNTVSNENIDIAILGNTFTAGGDELSLIVEITNKNNLPLELVDLVVEYPKGSADNLLQDTERFRESLGAIPAGAVRSENVKLVLFGEQGSVRPIKISIEYRIEGSNAIFVKEKPYEVSINSTPIDISIDGSTSATPSQDIILNVKSTLNATKPVSQVLLKVDYPVGFQFISAKPAPTFGNNVWNLGDLSPGTEQNISITGRMLDVFDGEEKVFHILSGSQSTTDKSTIDVVFNSVVHTVLIKKPLIEATLFINGVHQREYAVNSKTLITGQIRWTNNLETKINDLSIRAKISGNAVNRKSINEEQGFYNSSEDTIIWDKNSQSQFREVSPGDSGSVSFSLASLPLFSALNGMLASPSINIEITISGKQSLEAYVLENLTSQESSTIRIISDVGFAAKALYYSGPFVNKGPIPPKVEQETTYTVVWALSNTSNSISKAKVTSTLPPWVEFVNSISPAGENLTYNPSTKEIVWNIGGIPKGAGITGASREVAFQIKFLPSLSQVNTSPTIINDSILTGHDDFANVDVRVNKASLNIRLANDPAFPVNGDRVVE